MDFIGLILEYFSTHVGVQDWIALIALNITVIGLTSLAEKRTVIGVDYGKYLMDSYKFLGLVRIFHMLVAVAIINAAALVVMLHGFSVYCEVIVFGLLILSSWFVLLYLFSFVLRVHPRVKREIYREQILGLYIDADIECNFKADNLVEMHGGDRTPKKISSNVQNYFNDYNEETIEAFAELFGPDSPVYARDKSSLRYWRKLGHGKPHDYNVKGTTGEKPVNHISWEFFQMFRYSEIQERWILEILNLFNGSYADACPRLRLFNVARVFGQLNRVGFADGIWHYKFLDYLMPFVQKALDTSKDGSIEQRKEVERYLHEQISLFIQKALASHYTETYEESVNKAFGLLLSIEHFRGVIPVSERFDIYEDGAVGTCKKLLQSNRKRYKREVKEIKNVVFDYGNVLVDWKLDNLFGSYFQLKSRKKRFYQEVINDDWIRIVDGAEDLQTVVEERIQKFPSYKKALENFRDNWNKTVSGEVDGMEELLNEIMSVKSLSVYGLSNWCKSTFVPVREEHPILQKINKYVISGGLADKTGKPISPKPSSEIFDYFLEKYALDAASCFFIDDKIENVTMARKHKMKAYLFSDAAQLKLALESLLPRPKKRGSTA